MRIYILLKTLTSWTQRDKTLQETVTFMDKGKIAYIHSDPGGTLEKIKHWLKPLLSPNEELHVSQEVKENAPASEGKSYRPVITAEDQYAYYDLLLRVSGTNHICSVKTLQSIIPGEGSTALYGLYGLYGYVPLRRVWFSSSLL